MSRKILVIDAHPDPAGGRFVNALASAYADAARSAGHTVREIALAKLDIPVLRSASEFATPAGGDPAAVRTAILDAEHLVLVYPLWLGSMPAFVKAALEQIGRDEGFLSTDPKGGWPRPQMKGRSARVVVTMGMPAMAYRVIFGAHSLKALEQGILKLAGFAPVHDTIFGMVEAAGDAGRAKMLDVMRDLGRRGV